MGHPRLNGPGSVSFDRSRQMIAMVAVQVDALDFLECRCLDGCRTRSVRPHPSCRARGERNSEIVQQFIANDEIRRLWLDAMIREYHARARTGAGTGDKDDQTAANANLGRQTWCNVLAVLRPVIGGRALGGWR